MYASGNPKTKKALKEAVATGTVTSDDFFQPGLGNPPPQTGKISVEGPHYPKPHTWYASVTLVDGVAVKVT